MSSLDKLSGDERITIDDNIACGYGEIITYEWKEVVSVDEEYENEDGKKAKRKIRKPVEHSADYYVGLMDLSQTTAVLSILGVVFVNGANFQQRSGRQDNIVYLEYLDETALLLLVATILKEERDFIKAHWNPVLMARIIRVFFRYNDFFALIKEAASVGKDMGLEAEQVRAAALGKTK